MLALVFLVACGGQQAGVGNLLPTSPVLAALRLENALGAIVLGPGAVSGPSPVTLLAPQTLPPLKGARALATLHINLGLSELQGPVEVAFAPVAPKVEGLAIVCFVEGVERYFPLDGDGLVGVLNLSTGQAPVGAADADGRDIHFVLVSFDARPGYQVWNSFNGYTFERDPQGQVQLRQFVSGGTPVGSLPALGSRPLMLVHGLGDNIRDDPRWLDLARRFLDSGTATGVVAFEYDTQDSVARNGQFLRQFYQLVGAGLSWRHVAHSMGSLVSRACFEQGGSLPLAASGNRAFFLCGPHLGTPVISVLQSNLSITKRFLRYLVLHEVLIFRNQDGSLCDVEVSRAGFTDLGPGSPFLQQLNQDAGNHHAQFTYATLGGTSRGLDYALLDLVLGVTPDDGLVFLNSANFSGLASQLSTTAAVDHSQALVQDASLNQVTQFLAP